MTMRLPNFLILLALSTSCLGQALAATDAGAAASATPAPTDFARMTPEQAQQFRCEQTREQIQEQLKRKGSGPSDLENLASLRKNEAISCVPPLVSPPPMAASMPAEYPAMSVRQHHQGVAIVRVELAADGSVTRDSIYKTSGYLELDHSALKAVQRWHFDASAGRSQRVPVRFSLAN